MPYTRSPEYRIIKIQITEKNRRRRKELQKYNLQKDKLKENQKIQILDIPI